MNITGIFFDFGGTLMNAKSDKEAHYHLMNAVKQKYALKTTTEKLLAEYEFYVHKYPNPLVYEKSHGMKNIKNAFCQILSARSKIPDYNWFWEEYMKNHIAHVRLNKHAQEVLVKIKSSEPKSHLGLISDADDEYLYKQMSALDILGLFDSITTSEEVGFRKPAKEIFRKALGKAKCKPENAIYIGDNVERDILGAQSVGMTAVLFSGSIAKCKETDFVITSLNNLLDVIFKLKNTGTKK